VLREASLIGAALAGADFAGADMTGADLNWTAFDPARATGACLDHARLPVRSRIAYGPAGVSPPEIAPKPVYPAPLGAADLAAKVAWRPRGRAEPSDG
jgi:uncharacterized protein YjbI with pentapeptide repeats